MTGQQKWMDKAVVGAVSLLILWPLAFTAGAGAIQQAQLGSQVISLLDGLVHQQIPHVQIGPIPLDMMPQNQQSSAPAAYPPPPPPPFPSQNQQPGIPTVYGAPPPPPPFPSQNQQPGIPTVYGAPPPPPPFPSQNQQSSALAAYGAPPLFPSKKLICVNCQTPNDEDGKYCMSCGQALVPKAPQKALCPKCGAQTKPNATFCTQCGTSLFQANNGE
jgi:ribosomal protein L40E